MQLRISPVERPQTLLQHLSYWYMKRLFGKVITVCKVVYARFPSLLFLTKKIQDADKSMPLSKGFQLLIKSYVATLNGCPFCIDIAQRQAIDREISLEKFAALDDVDGSPVFSEKERLALQFVREITVHVRVKDELYDAVATHWTDEEIIALSYFAAIEGYYNRLIKPLGIGSDELCAIATKQPVR